MTRSYSLDAKAAEQAGIAQYITESGKYIGKLTRAEAVLSQQGTEGVELSFVTDGGLKADYITLWTYNKAGDALPSLKALSALMVCMRVNGLKPTTMSISDSKGTRTAEGFPDLLGKPVGLVLQREERIKNDGSTGYQLNLVLPFDARTEMTAGEIIHRKTEPEQLARVIANLKDKPAAKNQQRTASTGSNEPDWMREGNNF